MSMLTNAYLMRIIRDATTYYIEGVIDEATRFDKAP